MSDDKYIKPPLLSPGEILRDELRDRGFTQKEFAKLINVRQSHLSEYINGVRNFTAQFAFKLQDALNIPASTWLSAQKESAGMDKELSKRLIRERKAEEELRSFDSWLDMSDLMSSDNLDKMSKVKALSTFKKIYNFQSKDEVRQWILNDNQLWNKSRYFDQDPRIVATAYLRDMRLANKRSVTGTFKKNSFDSVTQKLVKIFHDNYEAQIKVEEVLSDAGIRIGYPIIDHHDSIISISTIEDGIPTILLHSFNFTIDELAFSVLHELWFVYHILSDYQKIHIRFQRYRGIENDTFEKKAEEYAMTALVPNEKWKLAPSVFMNAAAIQEKYSKWAEDNGLNKWIVLGRIRHETGMYAFKDDKARELNTPASFILRDIEVDFSKFKNQDE